MYLWEIEKSIFGCIVLESIDFFKVSFFVKILTLGVCVKNVRSKENIRQEFSKLRQRKKKQT